MNEEAQVPKAKTDSKKKKKFLLVLIVIVLITASLYGQYFSMQKVLPIKREKRPMRQRIIIPSS